MKKNLSLIVVLILIGSVIWYLESQKASPSSLGIGDAEIQLSQNESIDPMRIDEKEKAYPRAKEIVAPSGFLNTPGDQPITIEEIIGDRIVMVDFWTYSCINCQRTMPYLRAWHDKYAEHGLTILGLHSPEFEFEKERANVEEAMERFGVRWPVVQDNDFGTWRAYKNRYWPRKYLIDVDGFIVYDHIGEGAYASTEMKIQELLKELKVRKGEDPSTVPTGVSEPLDVIERSRTGRISPEVYFGSLRNEYFANGTRKRSGSQTLTEPESIDEGDLQLVGEWDIQREYSMNLSEQAKIRYRYIAKDVFMVLSADEPVRVQVLRNGKPLTEDRGADVDSEGFMTVQQEKLYKIVADTNNKEPYTLELVVEQPGLKAFTFTFG